MFDALRRPLAGLLVLGAPVPAAYAWATGPYSDAPYAVIAATFALPIAAVLLFIHRLETQIFARAVLWSNLVWLAIMVAAVAPTPDEATLIMYWTGGIGLGLLVLGPKGLDAPSHREAFAPVALRNTLVAILVLAMADTLALSFWSAFAIEGQAGGPAIFIGTSAVVMLVAMYGLYRLRTWGFILNVAANAAIAAGAWLVPDLPTVLAVGLSATAVGQLLVGLPLMRGIVAGDAAPSDSMRRSSMVGAALVTALVTVIFVHLF